jgi:hypothetical protein
MDWSGSRRTGMWDSDLKAILKLVSAIKTFMEQAGARGIGEERNEA